MDPLTKELKIEKKRIVQASAKVTRWIGSPASLIAHTLLFGGSFLSVALGLISFERMFEIQTSFVSLEAIYLAIFIQMTVNRHSTELEEVSEDIEEIQEDVEDIQEDVGEIQEDVEDIQETDSPSTIKTLSSSDPRFERIENTLQTLLREISDLKNQK